ncbi:MAG: phosphopentomutase [Ignavibacteriaceae bacterium]|jgi:phosphopentomutase|nr:phosphopentomutase [Ignavibacteriaceae bacterium]MCW8818037.1 phosphopentomutase [Ignavibacteriaceae bacterium]MCW8822461.1 phosphopentomutase [Ignavibacteriaceae bacterium]MCW8961213.1 phosphopentomutase [Ignavibacteriaceae bacterium]MCW9095565.1 phosphopentomutase [Ignavibacteriaceae bacterium]
MKNFFVIVLDGVGIGELPDAYKYNDQGSNTLANIAQATGGLNLANLEMLGLGNIEPIKGIEKASQPLASFGKMAEVSQGKDSTTGHWELAGLHVKTEFTYFPNGFDEEIVQKFLSETGCKGIIGNKPASGTEIIEEYGKEHIEMGYPIIYTSADSVFQIAAHEEVIPLQKLYEICSITREKVLTYPLQVGRVIARPFIGAPGSLKRTKNRKDFSLDPPEPTILDILSENDITTIGVGKINDLFNYKGIQRQIFTKSNEEGCDQLLKLSAEVKGSFIFINLVDFDVYFGHRNDPAGFAEKLKEFDDFLPHFLNKLDDSDRLIITADHGNDPTTPSTDHSREYVPLLYYRKNVMGKNLGVHKTFSDVGKTVADFFNVTNNLNGTSFLND